MDTDPSPSKALRPDTENIYLYLVFGTLTFTLSSSHPMYPIIEKSILVMVIALYLYKTNIFNQKVIIFANFVLVVGVAFWMFNFIENIFILLALTFLTYATINYRLSILSSEEKYYSELVREAHSNSKSFKWAFSRILIWLVINTDLEEIDTEHQTRLNRFVDKNIITENINTNFSEQIREADSLRKKIKLSQKASTDAIERAINRRLLILFYILRKIFVTIVLPILVGSILLGYSTKLLVMVFVVLLILATLRPIVISSPQNKIYFYCKNTILTVVILVLLYPDMYLNF